MATATLSRGRTREQTEYVTGYYRRPMSPPRKLWLAVRVQRLADGEVVTYSTREHPYSKPAFDARIEVSRTFFRRTLTKQFGEPKNNIIAQPDGYIRLMKVL